MTKQSDERVPGRGRGGPPPSFGRREVDAPPAEDFTIRGGEAFHLVLHVDVTPSEESLAALREAVRENTRLGVLEGYAQAFADMDEPEPPADGADGGASSAGPGTDEAKA